LNKSYKYKGYTCTSHTAVMFYVDEDGFLNSTKYISRVNYNLKNDEMQILKWKLKWFSNKYSHDYTVKCK